MLVIKCAGLGREGQSSLMPNALNSPRLAPLALKGA